MVCLSMVLSRVICIGTKFFKNIKKYRGGIFFRPFLFHYQKKYFNFADSFVTILDIVQMNLFLLIN